MLLKFNFWKKIDFTLLVILLIATSLRFAALFKYGDYWWDEIFSVTYSQKPWLDSIKYWTWETNPFLHMLILKCWFYLFTPNEITARLPSIIFGTAGVWALFRFGKVFFNKRIAYIAALLLALAPYHIFMSSTARGYALLILLSIINVHYFLLLFYKQEKLKKNIVVFAITLLLLLFTHLTAAWVIIAELIVLMPAGKKSIIEYVKYSATPFIIWLVWAIPSVYFKLTNPLFFNSSWFFLFKSSFKGKIESLQSLFFGPLSFWPALIIISFFFTVAGYTLYKQIKNKKIDNLFYTVGIFFLIPLITTQALNLWNIKFFIISLPWLIIIIAYLLNNYLANKLVITAIIFLATIPGLVGLNRILPLSDWTTINNCVAARTKKDSKQIFVYDYYLHKLLFDRYYKSAVPTLGYFPENDYANWDRRTITTNYLMYKRPDVEIEKWMDEQKLADFDEILIMQDKKTGGDIAVDIVSVLDKKNYILIDQCRTRLADGKKVIYYYAKPERTDKK